MPTATILPLPRAVFYDASGNPLVGGFVYTYVPGGAVPKLTWQDAAETTPNANPIVLDADGSALIYGSGYYQMTVTDALGNQVPAYSGLTQDFLSVIADAVDTLGFVTAVADLDALRALDTGASPVWVDGVASGMFNIGAAGSDNGGTIIVSGAGTYYREPAGEPYSLSWFGGVGDGTIDDTDAVSAAQPTWTFITSGTYKTTIAPDAFNGAFWGTGQIIDSAGNKRGKFFSEIQTPPTSVNNDATVETAFNGDWSRQTFAIEHRIYGVATLGQPATGYLYTDNAYPFFGYLYNESGWNNATDSNVGRAASCFSRVIVEQNGQGDAVAYNAKATITSTKAGATSWLASPAGVLFNGDVNAGADGCYLNAIEIDCLDHGFDAAGVGLVLVMGRSNSTAAIGQAWMGIRIASIDTAAVDAAVSLSGKFTIGYDLTSANLGTAQAAFTLLAGQKIYFGSTPGASSFPAQTTPGGAEIYQNSGVLTMAAGAGGLQVGSGGVVTTVQLQVGGACLPTTDNTFSCGGSSNRWTVVYATTGAINTSDVKEKQNIEGVPAALLDAWDSMAGKTFRMKDAVGQKGDGARTHVGYIAQEFAEALAGQGLVPGEWGAWCSDEVGDGERQGLRYDELFVIAEAAARRRERALTDRVQRLSDDIAEIKRALAHS